MGIFSGAFFSDITGGKILTAVGEVFGKKGTQTPATYSYTPARAPAPPPVAKKDNTMLFMIGGGAAIMMMMFMFMKK